MSRLKELGKDKLTVLQKLISSQDLCKALYYSESDFLEKPDILDTSNLIRSKISPFNRIPDLTKNKSTFLTFNFRDYRLVGNKFKSGFIEFHVITHQDYIYTDYESLRYDMILSYIDEMFNENRELGIGKLLFHRMDEFYVNTEYVGTLISYKLWEFN